MKGSMSVIHLTSVSRSNCKIGSIDTIFLSHSSSIMASARPLCGGAAETLSSVIIKSMFVSMGSPYSKVFIVDTNKHENWSAISEKYDRDTEKWAPFPQSNLYRASFVSRNELEHMIWNAEK